jgi:menaquinone-9 beta-reductase
MTAPTHFAVDRLVIGGGPAGSMLAARLAAAGHGVTLIERERQAHDKVCGEFLSREAIHYLHQAGVDPVTLGAQIIHTVRLSAGRKIVSTPLPFQALSLSRRALDEALLVRAADAGARVIRGAAVESLSKAGEAWTARLSSGGCVCSPEVFLATGKHELRGWARTAGRQNDLIGFKLHLRVAPAGTDALRHHMDLYLFPGGYGGLSLIEDEVANLCLVVRRSVLSDHGAWPQLLDAIVAENSHLGCLLTGAQPLWPRPLAISPIPYGYLAADERALWRIGDQAAVIPSFTGDGISIALHSAALAVEMSLAGGRPAEFHRTLRAQLRRSMALATIMSRSAVTGPGRAGALFAVSTFPLILRSIAARTRIPQQWLLGHAGTPHKQGAGPPNISPTPQHE